MHPITNPTRPRSQAQHEASGNGGDSKIVSGCINID